MLREELIKRSPIRILEKTIHGGLGAGNLGVFTARKGVGKTACLVHLSVDKLLRGQKVLHVSFAEEPTHIKGWYKQVYDEIADTYNLDDSASNFEYIIKNRLIMHFRHQELDLKNVKTNILEFVTQTGFHPEIIIIDGFSFFNASIEDFKFWKTFAGELKTAIWFSATLHREALQLDNDGIPAPVNKFKDLFSVIIMLEPMHKMIHLNLLKDHENTDIEKLRLKLNPKTLLISNHRA